MPASPKRAKGNPAEGKTQATDTRRRLPNGMGKPIMVRPQQDDRDLVVLKSRQLGVSMGLLAERLMAVGIRVYRQRGVEALDLPEVL